MIPKFDQMPVQQPDFKVLFESLPGLYLIVSKDLIIITASDSYLSATMQRRENIIGKYLFDAFPENPGDPHASDSSVSLRTSIQTAIANRNTDVMGITRYDITNTGGVFEERYWLPTNKAIVSKSGLVEYVIHQVEDVTELVQQQKLQVKKKQPNNKLQPHPDKIEAEVYKRSQELYARNEDLQQQVKQKTAELTDFFDRITDGFIGFDVEGKVIFINRRATQLTGISESSFNGKAIKEAFGADIWHPFLAEAYYRAVKQNEAAHVEFYSPVSKIWLAVDVYPSDSGLSIFFRDISERKKVQQELVQSEERYRSFVEEAVDAILVYSPGNKHYVEANKKAVELLGYSQAEFMKLGPADITFPDNKDQPRIKDLEAGKTTVRETLLRRKDGTGVYVESSARKMPDGNYMAVVRDITEKKKVERSIKEARELADRLIDSLPGVFYFYDSSGKFIRWNKQFEDVTGYSAEEIEQMHPTDFFLEEDKPYIAERIGDVFIKGVNDAEARFITKSGVVIPYYFKAVLINYEGAPCLLGNGIDITERRKYEEELKGSEKKYKLLFESNPLPMWMLHLPEYNIVEVNTSALLQYGYSKEEFLKLDIFTLRPEEDVQRIKSSTNKTFRGIHNAGVWRHQKKNHDVIYVEVMTHDIFYEGAPTRLVLANEITEKYHAEEKLKKSYDSVRELTAHLQDVREEERTHIAREIHDELGQLLTVLKMDVSWLNKKVGMSSAVVQDKFNELLKLIDLTVKTIRRIASELRPSLIDDLGLAAAMEWFIEDFERRSGIKKEINISGTIPELPDAMKIGIFRIFQESLTNVARHSGGNKVMVRLQQADNHLILTITDNGKGFDERKANKKTLGLLGMRERTVMMGGEYNIKGRPGEGTTVTVIIPLADTVPQNEKVL